MFYRLSGVIKTTLYKVGHVTGDCLFPKGRHSERGLVLQ